VALLYWEDWLKTNFERLPRADLIFDKRELG
jgi:hypothetical protein